MPDLIFHLTIGYCVGTLVSLLAIIFFFGRKD